MVSSTAREPLIRSVEVTTMADDRAKIQLIAVPSRPLMSAAILTVTTFSPQLTSTTPTVLSSLSLLIHTILPNSNANTNGINENNRSAVVDHHPDVAGLIVSSGNGIVSKDATKPHHEQRKRRKGMAIAVTWNEGKEQDDIKISKI
jgi:hypothetical protein